MSSKLKEWQDKYGKPTVEESVTAFYRLKELEERARKVEYPHNFQRERFDLVEYIYSSVQLLKILKGY